MRRPPSHFDYHGLHVAARHQDAVRVEWRPAESRCNRVRVREHTCSCDYPMYELCMGGGLWFIRCTPEEDPQLILESPWKTAGVVQELWFQIVTGQAW